MKFYIRRPHINPDKLGAIVTLCHVRRPVQQRSAESDTRITSADYHAPDVQRGLMASVVRPDGLFVLVPWLIDVHGNSRGRDIPVPSDPRLAFEQVIQYAFSLSGPVRPRTRPLVGVLVRPKPICRLTDQSAYFGQVPWRSRT